VIYCSPRTIFRLLDSHANGVAPVLSVAHSENINVAFHVPRRCSRNPATVHKETTVHALPCSYPILLDLCGSRGLLPQLSQANINKQGSVVKRFFSMEPSESKSNTKEVVEGKPVKEIAERAVSLETKASVKSAVDHLETHGLEAAPVTDPEGTLVGKISKDQMIRGVSGRGHDPQTTPVDSEVEKEGEPYCYEHEPIAKAEEVMREVKVDAVSVVSEEKKLIGKATRHAIEEERLKAESGKPRTDLKADMVISWFMFGVIYAVLFFLLQDKRGS
jgi:CBS domain-containing protein